MANINCENEIVDGKNKNRVRCQFCNSLVLSPLNGAYLKQDEEIHLPSIHAKNTKDPSTVETEAVTDFWTVGDMFQFENIGFSNTVENRKYLTCADCDMGPVGYQDVGQKTCYVALSRVKHEN